MKYTEWKIPYAPARGDALIEAGYMPLLAGVLAARGAVDPDQARQRLSCGVDLLGNPFGLADMDKAVRRINLALERGEHVAVYGDYDVDGITSSCLLADYLRRRGLECEIYIPCRLKEGYGVNVNAIDELGRKGVSLIITVDCGVTAVDEADFAASLGIDMIITDHHECRETLPRAAAVIDPKRADSGYEFRELAGVGVAFKLLCALEGGADSVLREYSDLVAIGTVADVMPIEGENRTVISAGLTKLNCAPRPGLRALAELSGMGEKELTANSLSFSVAPRINASGRLGETSTAVGLLLASDDDEARGYAEELCVLNRRRQELENDIWMQALALLGGERPAEPIVLAGEDWHQGVIGIVASRLSEEFGVPSVMICFDGDEGKGSCRSTGDFNLFDALRKCSDTLESYGGHALAAGLTLRRERLEDFRRAFAECYASREITSGKALDIDLRVDSPELLSMENVRSLEALEPCGSGNPRPVLCVTGAFVSAITPLANGKHTRLRLDKFGRSYEAVFFSRSESELGVRCGDYVDAAFTPQINEYRSRRSVQLLLTDLRLHDLAPVRRILGGEIICGEDPAPPRDSFVRIWLALRGMNRRVSAPLSEAAEILAPALWDREFAVCLKAFEDGGLVRLDFDGNELSVEAVSVENKVDLTKTQTMRRLSHGEDSLENEGR